MILYGFLFYKKPLTHKNSLKKQRKNVLYYQEILPQWLGNILLLRTDLENKGNVIAAGITTI